MRLPWKRTRPLTRAEAVMRAIDTSDPGDLVTIHEAFCTDPTVCCCSPMSVIVNGEPGRRPIGFRIERRP